MKNRLLLVLFIIILLFPVSIRAQAKNIIDPLYGEQWALQKIGFDKAGISQQVTENKLIGKKIMTAEGEFFYEEKPFTATQFKLQLGETRVRRLSIELANPIGAWTVEVRNNRDELVSKNTTTYKRLDLLLSKETDISELSISLKKVDGNWDEAPFIQKITAVHSAIVAVIDSGVIEHEDFCDNILYSLGADYIEGMILPWDTNGHGTHVTGIIAACNQNGVGISGAIGGAAVDVIPFKVIDKNGLSDDFKMAAAVQDAIKYDVDVINISIAGSGTTIFLEKAIREALLSGIPVVAAAGNGGDSTENIYPANLPGVITVAGVNQYDKKVPRSNYGWEVEISAPGFDILSTYTSPGYTKKTGTSMAAPYVTSVIAYYKSVYPNLDFVQISRLLANTALDLGGKGYDVYTGAGLVQFSHSIDAIENIDWLNLKDGQPANGKSEIVLGFSRELVGKKVLLFKDERIFQQLNIDKMVEEISINEENLALHDNSIVAVVVDDKQHVSDYSSISIVNSDRAVSGGNFKDVLKSHWAYDEISAASRAELINGYPDGSFKPSESINRRQSLMMLNRLFASERPSSLNIPFKDVTLSTSGVLAILNGSERGYIKGVNGYFKPENKLTRGQMALILARALKVSGSSSGSPVYSYHDVPKQSEYYGAVQALTEKGIITKQTYFRPNQTITRAQFAAMLIRTKQAL